MDSAIIGGTGVYGIPGFELEPRTIETEYGPAWVNIGRGQGQEIVFLARHGVRHTIPPHSINFRANIRALQMLGVRKVLATFAVGSINRAIPPEGVALVTDFIDFTHGRPFTFFDGSGPEGVVHTSMDAAYCPALGARLLELAPQSGLEVYPNAVYVASNGPRFETPAEIRAYEKLGGDVVGMTGVPEVVLAHELGLHYAALAYSMNWAAGLEKKVVIVGENLPAVREKMLALMLKTLAQPPELACGCESARL